jgi:glycerol-3-phosphate dehydrogenase
MALKLADVVLRRTEMGTERCPDRSSLDAVAAAMGRELGWTELRRQAEVDETLRAYAPLPVPGPREEEASRHAER